MPRGSGVVDGKVSFFTSAPLVVVGVRWEYRRQGQRVRQGGMGRWGQLERDVDWRITVYMALVCVC